MAIVRPLGSPDGHCTDQSYLQRPSKVSHYSLGHALNGARASSVCYAIKFQNCSTSVQFQENSSKKSVVKSGSLENQTLNSVSSANK